MGRAGFASDKSLSQRGGIEQLKFIDSEFNAFKIKASKKDLEAFEDFKMKVANNEQLSDKSLSYIDGMYEKTMKGLGLPSFKPTFRPKKRY